MHPHFGPNLDHLERMSGICWNNSPQHWVIRLHDEHKILQGISPHGHTNDSPPTKDQSSTESKDKDSGFFKRLFKHDKDTEEEPKKATGTP
jgi:hypothetical protein